MKKNYCITYMASQMKQACVDYASDTDEKKYHSTLWNTMQAVKTQFPTPDADLEYVYAILERSCDPAKAHDSNLAMADNL